MVSCILLKKMLHDTDTPWVLTMGSTKGVISRDAITSNGMTNPPQNTALNSKLSCTNSNFTLFISSCYLGALRIVAQSSMPTTGVWTTG